MSTSIGKLTHVTRFPITLAKMGEVRLAPITIHFSLSHACIDHRLGMWESCVKGVMAGIRLCQQSSFLHQAVPAAMASGILPWVRKRKMCPVHLLDAWYLLAGSGSSPQQIFFYMEEPGFPEALGGTARAGDFPVSCGTQTWLNMSSVHETTAEAGKCLLCITIHHNSGLWSAALPEDCTKQFSTGRSSDSNNWQRLTLLQLKQLKWKKINLWFGKFTAQPLGFFSRCTPHTHRLGSSWWTCVHLWAWQDTKSWLATEQARLKYSQENAENTFLNKKRELVGKCCWKKPGMWTKDPLTIWFLLC